MVDLEVQVDPVEVLVDPGVLVDHLAEALEVPVDHLAEALADHLVAAAQEVVEVPAELVDRHLAAVVVPADPRAVGEAAVATSECSRCGWIACSFDV